MSVEFYDYVMLILCFIIGVLVTSLVNSFRKSKSNLQEMKQEFDVVNPINGKAVNRIGNSYTDEYGITWSRMLPLNNKEV